MKVTQTSRSGSSIFIGSSLRVQERRPGFFDENVSRIGEIHRTSLVTNEQVESVLFFEFSALFTERRCAICVQLA